MQDIARATGLSLPTVSRVLSGSTYPISGETRRRVLQAAEEMGYRPNLAARSLRTKRTNTVGIIVDDIMSAFVPPMVRGIQDRLLLDGFSGLVVNVDWTPEREHAAIADLLGRPVDGIVFVEYSHLAADSLLARSGKPHFFVHRLFGTQVRNSVIPDDRRGAELAVDHLVALGHRRVGLISGPVGWHSARTRVEGYRAALKRHELEQDTTLVEYGDWEVESGYAAARRLLDGAQRPTALFCANDLMALGAVYAAQDAGLAVPGDLAVVGYDNRDFAAIVRPPLTTVSMPVYEMGRTAADLLLRQILYGELPFDEVKVLGELLVRETCGAPEAERTRDEPSVSTMLRRLLLNRQPDA